MKKKLLPLAILAGLAEKKPGTARPVYTPGLGELLIYPFYSIDTEVTVCMLEDDNAQQVIDFNLYLSPLDELDIPPHKHATEV